MHCKTKQEVFLDIQGYASSLEIFKKNDGEGS